MPTLRKLTEGAAAVTLVQLLAPADLEPPKPGNVQLEDSETGETLSLYIDTTIQEQYRKTLQRLQQSWDHAAQQTGAELVTLIANNLQGSLRSLEECRTLEPA